jgi:hypothetical protein
MRLPVLYFYKRISSERSYQTSYRFELALLSLLIDLGTLSGRILLLKSLLCVCADCHTPLDQNL